MSQTIVQDADAIRKGSVLVKIGVDFDHLVDIGALRDPKLTSLSEAQSIEFDNVDDLRQFAEGDKAELAFTLCEINYENIALFDKGIINLEDIAGSATPVTAEAHGTGWDIGVPFGLNNKNGDNSEVSSIVVKAGVTTLDIDDDYVVYVGDGSNGTLGVTYIVPVSAQAAAITVGYSYTPNASKRVTFNKFGTKELVVCRMTNTNADGKVWKLDMDNVTNVSSSAIDFAGDDEAEVATMAITLQGYITEIIDEQAA